MHAPIFLNLSHSRSSLSRPHQINYRNIETCLEEHRTSYFLLPLGAHATHASSSRPPPSLAAIWAQDKKHNSFRGFPLQRSPTPSQMFYSASSSSKLRLMPVPPNFSCSFSNLFLPSRVLAHVARSETPASYGTLCNIVLHLTKVSTAGLCNPVIKFCAAHGPPDRSEHRGQERVQGEVHKIDTTGPTCCALRRVVGCSPTASPTESSPLLSAQAAVAFWVRRKARTASETGRLANGYNRSSLASLP